MSRVVGWILLVLNIVSLFWHLLSPYGSLWLVPLNFLGAVVVAFTLAVTAD